MKFPDMLFEFPVLAKRTPSEGAYAAEILCLPREHCGRCSKVGQIDLDRSQSSYTERWISRTKRVSPAIHIWRMPPTVRELIAKLEKSGFKYRSGKGSHRKYVHPATNTRIIVSGRLGDDAKRYQERQVRDALEESKQ